MNEVTKIHLGRQAFAISSEAHRELRGYLDAIKRQVSDAGVINEIELRMAELLDERGVDSDKVILPADVEFLKEQLGDPKDFADEDGHDFVDERPAADTKRLFRDTDNAMVAGVAAGLANYFGVDVLLVRLLFVIATFTGGWGILIYLVLWLLVPEAKTTSERLQMAGKPVTIAGLKEVVERADVKGAARRTNNSLAGPVNALFRFILKLVGTVLVAVGLALLFGLLAATAYVLFHSGSIVQDNLFPVGFKEHLLVYIAAATMAILAIFIILLGMAMFRRKWPVRGWITGVLASLVFIGFATSGAMAAAVAPQVRDRYNSNLHTTARTVQPFTKVNLDQVGDNETISYQTAPTYSVKLHYFGHPDLSTVKTSVSNGTLVINSRQFNWQRNCDKICIPTDYDLSITISSPNPPKMIEPQFSVPPLQPTLQ